MEAVPKKEMDNNNNNIKIKEDIRPTPKPRENISIFLLIIQIIIHTVALFTLFIFDITYIKILFLLVLYSFRIFIIHAGNHRLFAHRAYKTSRVMQIFFTWNGCATLGNSPLLWAAHHRLHHQYSDTELDIHSPKQKGFWWAHIGWTLYLDIEWLGDHYEKIIPEWCVYPELLWIEEHWYICMISEMIIFYFIWGIEGLCWEILSIVLTFHAVALTSSVSHIYGKRKYSCQYHTNCKELLDNSTSKWG